MDLDDWAAKAARLLELGLSGVSRVGILFPPTPDGIASSVIMSEILSQEGIESELIVSTPETVMESIEICAGKCDAITMLDLPPHGKGPLQVSGELFRSIIVVDHGSAPLLSYRNVIRINLDEGGIATSLLMYLIALKLSEDNDILSWVAASGFYGICSAESCSAVIERAKLSWPDLMGENSLETIQRSLVAASYMGDEWIYLAASALQESFDDPGWFLRGNSATASLLRAKVDEVRREIKDVLEDPFLMRGNFGAWESPEAYQRFVLSLIAREEVAYHALSFFYDPPLGFVYVVGDPKVDLYEKISKYLRGIEGSLFGGRGFASLIVDSEALGDLLYSLEGELGSGP
ncbi:MAG: hypothetical protein J7L91_00265 [Candidatus Korarchaeota archaeon]|nr:hypothetical protein [Candidatus Korarchaeota archaeon]